MKGSAQVPWFWERTVRLVDYIINEKRMSMNAFATWKETHLPRISLEKVHATYITLTSELFMSRMMCHKLGIQLWTSLRIHQRQITFNNWRRQCRSNIRLASMQWIPNYALKCCVTSIQIKLEILYNLEHLPQRCSTPLTTIFTSFHHAIFLSLILFSEYPTR